MTEDKRSKPSRPRTEEPHSKPRRRAAEAAGSGPSGPPGDGPDGDIEALAQDYLDLWQDHLAHIAQDPGVAQAWAKTMEAASASAMAFTAAAAETAAAIGAGGLRRADEETGNARGDEKQAQDAGPSGDGGPGTGGNAAPPNDGAPSAGLSSGLGNAHLGQLLERLDDIERRLAALEAGAGSGTPKPARKRPKTSA